MIFKINSWRTVKRVTEIELENVKHDKSSTVQVLPKLFKLYKYRNRKKTFIFNMLLCAQTSYIFFTF